MTFASITNKQYSSKAAFQLPLINKLHHVSNNRSTCMYRPRMMLATPSTGNENNGMSVSQVSSSKTSILPPSTLLEPVIRIDGIEEYLDAVKESMDKLVVLKIFAPWCRSCRALEPKVKRTARDYPQVRFFEMDYEQNKELCNRLGVTAMPTFLLYFSTAGEIDKFSCGPMRINVLREKIDDMLRGECLLDKEEGQVLK